MVVAAAAAAVVANPVAVVPVGSSAYRKKAGTAAGALETSFSQSPSLSLLVRTSTSKPFASISIPTAPLFSCSQETVSLRVDRAHQRSSRSSISASANEVQFGNQDFESVRFPLSSLFPKSGFWIGNQRHILKHVQCS
jgi:hypothetical protein